MRIDSAAAQAAPAPRRGKTDEAAAAATVSPPPTKPGKGAEHRSDVATVRQSVNHPDERATIVLPDLTAPRQGQCFAMAVATYQAVVAELAPPPAPTLPVVPPPTDEMPVVTPPLPLETTPVETPTVDATPVASA